MCLKIRYDGDFFKKIENLLWTVQTIWLAGFQ